MFDNDQMTDRPELHALRDSLAGVALPGRPPLEAIKARAHRHRGRRRPRAAGLLVTGAAAGVVLTLGLAGGLGQAPTHGTIGGSSPLSIRTPSYTLISDTGGKVTLIINPRKLFDATALQRDLARYDIPAKVTDGRFCSSNPPPAGLSKVVSMTRGGGGVRPTITFDPSAIPAGAELSFGHFRLTGYQLAEVALIDASSQSCTSTVPTSGPTQFGYMLLPPGKATSHG
jgi:hypothetical protein